MFGSCIEETVYVKGLCQILIYQPTVDVDHVGFTVQPEDAQLSAMLTCLVTVRLEADETIKDQLRKLAAGMMATVLVHADKLRSLNAEKANTHFWKFDTEAQLNRTMDGVTIADLRNFHQVMIGSRPLLQFIGAISVKTARSSGHRRSIR